MWSNDLPEVQLIPRGRKDHPKQKAWFVNNAPGQKDSRNNPGMQIAVGRVHNSEKPIGQCIDHLGQTTHLKSGLQILLADAFPTQRYVVHQRSREQTFLIEVVTDLQAQTLQIKAGSGQTVVGKCSVD